MGTNRAIHPAIGWQSSVHSDNRARYPGTRIHGNWWGENNLFVVNVSDAEGREFALLDPRKPSDQFIDVLMGQTTTRSLREAVDLESALLAAKTYAESGILDKGLHWKEC
jgi:hypothetical protein